MDALKLFESEWELKFDIGGCIGVVSQLLMVMVTVFLVTHSEGLMPSKTGLLPFCKPFELLTGTNEELHLHLLKLPHTEDKLTGYNLIAERFTDLSNTERNFHSACLLDIEEVHENTLSGLWTEVDSTRLIRNATKLGAEHKVELTHICPVFGT